MSSKITVIPLSNGVAVFYTHNTTHMYRVLENDC